MGIHQSVQTQAPKHEEKVQHKKKKNKKNCKWKDKLKQILDNVKTLKYEGTNEDHIEWAKRQLILLDMVVDESCFENALISLIRNAQVHDNTRMLLWINGFFYPYLATLPPAIQASIAKTFSFTDKVFIAALIWTKKHAPEQTPKLLTIPQFFSVVTPSSDSFLYDVQRELFDAVCEDPALATLWWNHCVKTMDTSWFSSFAINHLKKAVPITVFNEHHRVRSRTLWADQCRDVGVMTTRMDHFCPPTSTLLDYANYLLSPDIFLHTTFILVEFYWYVVRMSGSAHVTAKPYPRYFHFTRGEISFRIDEIPLIEGSLLRDVLLEIREQDYSYPKDTIFLIDIPGHFSFTASLMEFCPRAKTDGTNWFSTSYFKVIVRKHISGSPPHEGTQTIVSPSDISRVIQLS